MSYKDLTTRVFAVDDKKPKKLTIKQKKFVKEYVKNDGNGRDAAKAVYDVASDESAAVIASQNLNKVNVKEAIELALAKHNITIDAALAPIADGLIATKEQYTEHGVVETKDHSTRLKASGMALKLMGAERQDATIPQSVHFHNHQAAQKESYDL